ncbi:MAG: HD domain-containing phosphohydrolase [Actinomycetota bacterium]
MDDETREPGRARILVVEDEEPIRRVLVRMLGKHGYSCEQAGNGTEARAALAQDSFELVLSDVNMPGESGIDLVEDLLNDMSDLAVIMVTGVDDHELAERALDLGAYGYIIKPFEHNELLINVSNALRRRSLEIENRRHREKLEALVKERTAGLWKAIQELEQARDDLRASQTETIERLAMAAEFRDDETARHIDRMSQYCRLLTHKLTGDVAHSELVQLAAVMHDVGKIGISDKILLKPGKLTDAEYEEMKKHAEYGYKILAGGSSKLLELAATIAYTHHEKVDGSGYPRGLKADEIPLEGRIAGVADVFDALTTNRVYRKAFPLPVAVEMMKEGRGTHFDAQVLDAFLDVLDEAIRIKEAND